MTSQIYFKSPDETLDYDVDFSAWLDDLPDTDMLASAVVTVREGTVNILSSEVSPTVVKVWVQGGALAETAEIVVLATTAGGRTREWCIRLRIKEC